MRRTRSSARVGRTRWLAGAVAILTSVLVSAPAAADDNGRDRPLRPGDHIPATELGRNAYCVVPSTADDAVLVTMKRVLDANKVTFKVRLAAYETAWVESHANDLDCGDADSIGVFQQRASTGWTHAGDPRLATYDFLHGNPSDTSYGAIQWDQARPSWTAGQIAQAVQRSAYPDRYDQAESQARALIARAASLDTGHGSVAVASRGGAGLDAFVRAADGSVRHRHWDGSSWSGWVSLGGQATSEPAAIATGSGRLDVFVKGTDNRLYRKTWLSGQGWSGWSAVSSQTFTSAPAVTRRSYLDGLDLVVRGAGNELFHGFMPFSSGQASFVSIGGSGSSGPAVQASKDGTHLVVFVRDADGTLSWRMWTKGNNGWFSWIDMGSRLVGRPAVTSRGGYAIDLFFRDESNQLRHRHYTGSGSQWSAAAALGGPIYAAPAAYADEGTRIDVLTRDLAGDLLQKTWTGTSGWGGFVNRGGTP